MHIHIRQNMFVDDFLGQFPQEKRDQVIENLIVLGIDLANKTGSRSSQELYQLLKHLAKNIRNQTSGDLRSEIKTIQKQLRDLNELIQVSQRDNRQDKGTSKKLKPQYQQQIYEPHYSPTQQTFPTNTSQQRAQYGHTPNKLYQSRSHSQRNLTPKITESPPPPQIVYINKMNNNYDIKPQFDDRQIKKLLYGEMQHTERGRSHRPGKSPSPRQLVYSSQTSGGFSQRQFHGQQFYHNVDTRKQTSSPKKLPAYLQGVESKIKYIIDQDKQQYKEQLKERDVKHQEQGTVKKLNNNSLMQQNSAETDTYLDIQQYIQDQKKYQFSPVQEMNDDDGRHEEDEEQRSDTYSNFTPPDDEVKEFFQQQYMLQHQ